jgi:hypothetical protein
MSTVAGSVRLRRQSEIVRKCEKHQLVLCLRSPYDVLCCRFRRLLVISRRGGLPMTDEAESGIEPFDELPNAIDVEA